MSFNNQPKHRGNQVFLFEKEQFRLMLIGIAVIIIGCLLMIGGGSDDPNVFNESEIYSFRRITLAPIVIVIGLVIEFVAILKKPKQN